MLMVEEEDGFGVVAKGMTSRDTEDCKQARRSECGELCWPLQDFAARVGLLLSDGAAGEHIASGTVPQGFLAEHFGACFCGRIIQIREDQAMVHERVGGLLDCCKRYPRPGRSYSVVGVQQEGAPALA